MTISCIMTKSHLYYIAPGRFLLLSLNREGLVQPCHQNIIFAGPLKLCHQHLAAGPLLTANLQGTLSSLLIVDPWYELMS